MLCDLLQEAALSLLASLSSCEANVDALVEVVAPQLAITAMKNHPQCEKIQELGLALLGNVAGDAVMVWYMLRLSSCPHRLLQLHL